MFNGLQPLRLIYIRSGTLMAPAIEGLIGNTQRTANLARRLTLGQGHLHFP